MNSVTSKSRPAADDTDEHDASTVWCDLVDQIGRETATPLTAALERIHELASTGRIHRGGLRALRQEVEQARRAGMLAQQISRYASAPPRVMREALQLDELVAAVIGQRGRDAESQAMHLRPPSQPVRAVGDRTLVANLVNALLDWALALARSPIELWIDSRPWPVGARLHCRFQLRPADQFDDERDTDPPSPPADLDSLSWRLAEAAARLMGLAISRTLHGGRVGATVEFEQPGYEPVEGLTCIEIDQGFPPSSQSRSLLGSHVLVIASRRALRLRVRDAIRHMGLLIDFVGSIEAATQFCRDALPHAVVVESALRGERLEALRREVRERVPELPFIEISEEGAAYEMGGLGSATMGRVGREAIETALPSVLMFELSRAG